MIKKYVQILVFILLLWSISLVKTPVYAVTCTWQQTATAFSVNSASGSCNFSETTIGIDKGTAKTNTSRFAIPNGKNVTLTTPGGDPQTLIVGSLDIQNGGTVTMIKGSTLQNGSQIIIGQPAWMLDHDKDFYPASSTIYSIPSSATVDPDGKHYVSNNEYYIRVSDASRMLPVDCNDNDATKTTDCSSAVIISTGTYDRISDIGSGPQIRFGTPTQIPTPTTTLTPTPTPVNYSPVIKNKYFGIFSSTIQNLTSAWSGIILLWTNSGSKTNDGETVSSSNNLVAQWNFNEISNTTATNNAGTASCGGTPTNCDGTLTNMTTSSQDADATSGWTLNKRRWGAGALIFDGTDDFVTIPNRAALNITGALTLEAWIKPVNGNGCVLGKYDTNQQSFFFCINNGKIYVGFDGTGTGGYSLLLGNTIMTNEWHHVVGIYIPSTSLSVYLDGKLDGICTSTCSGNATPPSALYAGTSTINVGIRKISDSYFKGVIDSVRIYSRALTSFEILSNANTGNIEMQYRAGASIDVNDGTWTGWLPTTNDTQIENLDTSSGLWFWDINAASNANGNLASGLPQNLADSSVVKMEGTNSLKISLGAFATDANTKGIWHFEETNSSGNAIIKDSSSGTNHLTIKGTPSVQNGFFGKARKFTAANSDYLCSDTNADGTCDDNANFDSLAALSIEAWINPTTVSNQMIVTKESAGNYGYQFNMTATGAIRSYVCKDTTCSTNYAGRTSTGTLTAGQWTHVAMTWSPSQYPNIYINGVLSNGTTEGNNTLATSMTNSTASLQIGGYDGGATAFFNGYIDEVRVSNSARTATEIYESFRAGRDHRLSRTINAIDLSAKTKLPFWFASDQKGNVAELTIGETAYGAYELDTNTKSLWHMEEEGGSGAYILDASSNANNGTPTGTTITNGKIGKGRNFNGSSYIGVGSILPASTGTFDFWMYPTSTSTGNRPISDTGGYFYFEFSSADTFRMVIYDTGGKISPTVKIYANQWYHIAGTWGDGGKIKLYVNGQYIGETTAGSIGSVANAIQIGGINTVYFNGIIDEVRLSTVARTAAEINDAFEIGSRTHQVTINFKANLLASNLIADVNDTSFTIDETPYGEPFKITNIFPEEKIIIKENSSGTEYAAQGKTNTINQDTGAITVVSWDIESTFPSGGFTANATVFKWQQEWWDITNIMHGDGTSNDSANLLNAITRVSFRFLNGSNPGIYYLDDLRSGGPYVISGSTITLSPARQYFQFRSLISSSNQSTSPILTNTSTAPPILSTLTPTPTVSP